MSIPQSAKTKTSRRASGVARAAKIAAEQAEIREALGEIAARLDAHKGALAAAVARAEHFLTPAAREEIQQLLLRC